MLKFPMAFDHITESPSKIASAWQVSTTHGMIDMAIPPEFEGPGGGFSPEDLYGMALSNCFAATFKVYAEKSHLDFERLVIKARLTVDRDEGGRPWMAKIDMKIALKGVSNREKAQSLLRRTSESCMILNSVKTQKNFEFEIN